MTTGNYLNSISYVDAVAAKIHLMSIRFGNLYIHTDKVIVAETESIAIEEKNDIINILDSPKVQVIEDNPVMILESSKVEINVI